MNFNALNLRIIGYLVFIFVCIALPWMFLCFFLQNFSFVMWDEKSEYIENIGYFGSFLGGTLGVLLTAGSLFFLAITLNFEREKANQENFDNKFFLMLERLENIKDKINEDIKNRILDEINEVSEFSVRKTLEVSKKVIHKYNSEIGHYYRMLFQIMKMIDQNENKISKFDNVENAYYTNILRATLDYKLTQILAINTYYSEDFDPEYEQYAYYVRKYNFLEHMPFFVTKGRISESLLAIYLNCDQGFGSSSFVNKINKYVINSKKKSIICKYGYDLKYSFLKRVVGDWNINKCFLKISIKERLLSFKVNGRNWTGELINTYPESDEFIKCDIFNNIGYTVDSYFDEDLNLILIFDESSFMDYSTYNDFRVVKLKLVLNEFSKLFVEYYDESLMDKDYDFIQPLAEAVRLN